MPSEKQSSETKHLTGPVIIDLETNGLLKNTTEIHCIAVHYVDEGMTLTYNDTGAAELDRLSTTGGTANISAANIEGAKNAIAYVDGIESPSAPGAVKRAQRYVVSATCAG